MPLDEAKQDECPRSILHRFPNMESLLNEIFSAMRVKDSTGAFPYGLDSGKWPSRWFDAVRIFDIEGSKVEAARDKRKGG